MFEPEISRQLVTGACIAVTLLTSVSAVILGQLQPAGPVPRRLRESVVTVLWCSVGLALLAAAVPGIRNGIGDTPAASFGAAGILVIALMANAMALSRGLARSPQTVTSLLAAAFALIGTVLAVFSLTPGAPVA